MKNLTLLLSFILLSTLILASPVSKYNLLIAPGTLTENSVALLWDKQYAKDAVVYEVLLNNKIVASTSKTNYLFLNLKAATQYVAEVRMEGESSSNTLNTIRFKTAARGKVYNILDFGAKDDSATKNTHAIQSAIDRKSTRLNSSHQR